MHHLRPRLSALAAAFLLSTSSLLAQITVQQSTFTSSLNNSERSSINYQGFTGGLGNIDLGSASASAQSLNFSTYKPDTSFMPPTRSAQSFISPNGQYMAGSYPTATVCSKSVQVFVAGPTTYTSTSITYYANLSDGFFNLVNITRSQVDPPMVGVPADTAYFFGYMPSQMLYPLPLTYGTNVTSHDSTRNTDTEIERNTRTFNCNGFGNVTFPDGVTRAALRILETDVIDVYDSGSLIAHAKNVKVIFISEDLSHMEFSVDSAYTGGTTSPYSMEFSKRTGAAGVQSIAGPVPSQFRLEQNYPNPFNPSTTIEFALTNAADVTLDIYNVLGERVAQLVNEHLQPGLKSVRFDAANLPSGVYTYRLTAGGTVQSKKLMLLR